MMAMLSKASCSKFYNCEKDGYDLPDGFLSSFHMAQIERQRITDRQEIMDRIDAAMAYDPYNHIIRS